MAEKIITLENLSEFKGQCDSKYQDKLKAGENITITGSEISSKDTTYSNATASSDGLMSASDKSALDSLSGAVTSVSASGTSPLTLTGSISGNNLTIGGSVDSYSKSDVDSMIKDVESEIESATSGGVTTVTASGTSPLTLSASKSGTSVNISGSVDLSDYAKSSDLSSDVSSLESEISKKQDTLTAGTAIEITSSNVINCTIDTGLYVVVSSLPSSPASGNENKIHLVQMSETETNNIYTEYIWVDGAWEKLGELHATTDLSGYYTKTETDSAISTAISDYSKSFEINASGSSPLNITAKRDGNVWYLEGSVNAVSSSTNGYMNTALYNTLTNLNTSAITGVTASGTSPLSLSANTSGNSLTISGYVNAVTSSSDGLMTSALFNTLNTLNNSAVTTITTTNNGVLNLSATKSGNAYNITGSVNLSGYQGALSAGEHITVSSNVISATWPTISDLGVNITNLATQSTNTINISHQVSGTNHTILASINNAYGFATNSQLVSMNSTISSAYNKANSAYSLASTANNTASNVNSNLSNYLPLDGGTMTGDITLGTSGAVVYANGHIKLASGVELY